MKSIQTPLQALEAFRALQTEMKTAAACAEITGLCDSGRLHLTDALGAETKYRVIVTHSDIRARQIYEDFAFYDRGVCLYPAKDLIFYQADVHGNEIVRQRMRLLRRRIEVEALRGGNAGALTVVTTLAAFMAPQIPMEAVRAHTLSIAKRGTVDEQSIARTLVTLGYEKNYQVEAPGQFAIRGDIVDIFDLTEDNPYRIELWGDEVTSIRSFDILSQRSIESLEAVRIYPATELILDEDRLHDGMQRIEAEGKARVAQLRERFETEAAHRLDQSLKELKEQLFELGMTVNLESYIRYFYDDVASFSELFPAEETILFVDEPGRVLAHGDAVEAEFRESMTHRAEQGYVLPGQMNVLFGVEETLARMACARRVLMTTIPAADTSARFGVKSAHEILCRSVAPYNNSFESLVLDLKRYKKEGYRVLILSGSRSRAKRLTEHLRDNDVVSFYSEDPTHALAPGEIMTYYGSLSGGFAYPEIRFAVISESDIFTGGSKKKKRRKSLYKGEKIGDFQALKVGDYVVHEDHGLGIYRGLEKIEVDHTVKDYLKIEYAGGGNLYVLATGFSVIQKYAQGGDGEKTHRPKLNRLGAPEWTRTKEKVKSAVDEIAQDLVALYARRSQARGYQFGPDTVWQQEFEEAFPFEETEDQVSAIGEMKQDMQSDRIMDRLICGDVGFGKTEIAIRGAFKAVQENKQVAVLVPTTILAQQHYNTFVTRMKDFPVRVDLLSRFRTAKEQRKTISDLKKGMVDIVIGTHRLLSADVGYKDLGLLVVDEEQRFGVRHKEKIKQLKEAVDVLTLTATPIPRTLHMSLVGIRDMSLLTEAPQDRLPIQTFVCEQNDEMVREAVLRELSRGGQIYYVYNRVNTIADIAARLQKLIPQARIAFAHGQMAESALEKIMYDFISGEIDVLVSTTIIETGLDIPNVNTMIIHDSDKMGLSQLYQLRGRVGRSNRTAYAFLMYKKDKMLKEVAEKRLAAIREFTDLGSGYKIAMRDLEIRGAGNLLGSRQSGHMMAVGYDLYCRMLEDAIKTAKGGDEDAAPERFVTSIDLAADAYLPASYILNEEQKLEIYKRIAGFEAEAEADDMRDELLDRFGQIPRAAENLIRISLLRVRANALYITEIRGGNGEVTFYLKPDAQIGVSGIPKLVKRFQNRLVFHGAGKPCFVYRYTKPFNADEAEKKLLADTEAVIAAMEEEILP